MKKALLLLTLLAVVITSTIILKDKTSVSRSNHEYDPARIQQSEEFTPAKPGDENVAAVNQAIINGDIQYAQPTNNPSPK